MKNKEFSGGGQEFSSPGKEFSRPGREWAFRPREIDCSSREYLQESVPAKPEKKKRRRLQPAMLTAAAVVTSAVVLAAPTKSGNRYPVQELSAEHRAYLDQVWTAMETSDLDALETLAKEDTLREIVVEVVAPYAHRLEEEYGFHGAVLHENSDFQVGGRYAVSYNGEVLAVHPGGTCLEFDYQKEDRSGYQNSYVHIDLYDYSRRESTGIWYDKSFFLTVDSNSASGEDNSYQHLSWWDMAFRKTDGSWRRNPVEEWDVVERQDSPWTGRQEAHIHGTFQNEVVYLGADRRLRPCLHNGQVTVSASDSSGRSLGGTIDVVEGYTTRWDDTLSMEHNDDEYFYRVALKQGDESVPLTLNIYEWEWGVLSEIPYVDPLYHQFRVNIAFDS